MWFDCAVVQNSKCSKTQSISCSKDWRLLIPLWRTNPLYHELRESHGHYENIHNLWRLRYQVAPDDRGIRPKRRGIGWQRLRNACALIAEWLRICARQGWLGSARKLNHRTRTRPTRWQKAGQEAADGLISFRHYAGITAPYGPASVPYGGSDEMPSERFLREREEEKERLSEEEALKQLEDRKRRSQRKKAKDKAAGRPPDPPPDEPADPF